MAESLMSDKEVGDAWRWATTGLDHNDKAVVRALIGKLVRERMEKEHGRAWITWIMNDKQGPSPSMIMSNTEALKEFGISEDEWKNAEKTPT